MSAGRRQLIAATVTVIAVASVVGASAASLGGAASADLSAVTMVAATGAPAVVAWENFNGATGTRLNGTTTDGGAKIWSSRPANAWTIQANTARSTSATSSLVIDAGMWSGSAVATIYRNGATTFDGGLIVNRNASASQYLSAEWTNTANGSLEIWKANGGRTRLARVTNLYPGGIATAPASITLKFTTASTGVLTAYIDGVALVTYTLTAAEQTMYKNATHQRFGLFQRTSNGLGWDDFHMDNP